MPTLASLLSAPDLAPMLAQAAGGGAGGGSFMSSFGMMAVILAIFYFLLIRPQQKKVKLHREMVGNVRRGDSVVTGGGIIGKITKVLDDNRVEVEIADNVKVQVARGTIQDVVTRGEPVSDDK